MGESLRGAIDTNSAEKSRGIWVLVLLVCLGASLFLLAYPVYVIQPFRRQGAKELMAALAVLRLRPIGMGMAVVLAAVATVRYWAARSAWWRRALVVAAALATVALAGLSRVNIYELMFHPAGRPAFLAANTATLDGAEKVLAVRVGEEARAYPIRSISYHHVVNDQVGGVPIVATY